MTMPKWPDSGFYRIVPAVWLIALFIFGRAAPLSAQSNVDGPTTNTSDRMLHQVGESMAWLLLNQKKYEEAEQLLRLLINSDGENATRATAMAIALLGQGKNEEAVQLLDRYSAQLPDNPQLHFALGRVRQQDGDARQAIEHFRTVGRVAPDWPDLSFYLGAALLQEEQNLAALRQLRRAQSQDPKIEQERMLLEGLALARLGLDRRATDRFTEIRTLTSTSSTALIASEFSRQVADKQDDRFHGYLFAGFRYDDNAGVTPTTNAFGIAFADGASWGHAMNGQATFDLINDGRNTLTIGGAFSSTVNYEDKDFDVTGLGASVTAGHRNLLGDLPYYAALTFNYDHLFIAYQGFLNRYSVTPTLTLVETDWTSTTFVTRYSHLDFLGQGDATTGNAARDRDADDFMFGLTQNFILPWQDVSLQLGYQFNRNFADGSDFDYSGHTFSIGIICPLPWYDMQLSTLVAMYKRDYGSIDSTILAHREDFQYSVSTALTCPLSDNVTLSFEYIFDRNDSNHPANDYKRNIFQIGVEYRW